MEQFQPELRRNENFSADEQLLALAEKATLPNADLSDDNLPLGISQVQNALPNLSQRLLDTLHQPLLLLNDALEVRASNQLYYQAFQTSPAETLEHSLFSLGNGQWQHADLNFHLGRVLLAHTSFENLEVKYDAPGFGPRTILLSASSIPLSSIPLSSIPLPVSDAAQVPAVVVLALSPIEANPLDAVLSDTSPLDASSLTLLLFEDITERKAEETRLRTQRRAGRAMRAGGRAERVQHVEDAVRAIRIAQGLQRALLQPIPENAFPDLAVTAAHRGAVDGSLGGDFFDAFLLPSGSVALVVGDVEGHGLEAAMRIGEIKYSLRAFLRESMDAAFTLSRLNDMVNTSHRLDAQAERLCTVVSLVVISPYTWEATFTRAGAEPPLILKADGTWEAVEAAGIMLGAREEAVYAKETRHLRRGETLLMFTDGLTEARVPGSLSFFGEEGIVKQVQEALQVNSLLTEEPLRGAGQAVLGAALAHARGSLADDACLLLARRR